MCFILSYLDDAKVRPYARHRVTVSGKSVVKSGNEFAHLVAELGWSLTGFLFEDISEI